MREQLVKSTAQTNGGVNPRLGITVHETGNTDKGANAAAHATLQANGNSRDASWHITVDDKEAVRSYPDTAQCWHAGNREANNTRIAVEICVNEDGDYDEAFRLAAETVRDLRAKHKLGRSAVSQHYEHSGKNCPAKLRAAGRWQEFLDLTEPNQKETQPMSPMISPFKGRLTQNHEDSGGYKGHAGMDIAPPLPGQTGLPVYAAFAGWIKQIHRTAKHGNLASTWAPYKTGNGMLVANPDGEGNGYNHMAPLASLKVGDWVEAGQLIGYNDSSGNQTGPHVHFELWADWKNPASHYDPQLAFKKFKVAVGSAPAKTVGGKALAVGNSKADNEAIQKALNAMGYDAGFPDGADGPKMKAAVRSFQEDHGLYPDEHWGPVTQQKYVELGRPKKPIKPTASKPKKTYRNLKRGSTGADVLAVARALRKQGYTKQGDTRTFTAQLDANVRDFQKRTGLKQDGVAGETTQKRLGL